MKQREHQFSRIGGPQIALRPMRAADYSEPIDFDMLAMLTEQRREIALGVLTAAGEVHLLNPDRGERLVIQDGDQLVTLTIIRDPE